MIFASPPPEDIWQCLGSFLIITLLTITLIIITAGLDERVLLASSGNVSGEVGARE